jgi:hypothetical protein
MTYLVYILHILVSDVIVQSSHWILTTSCYSERIVDIIMSTTSLFNLVAAHNPYSEYLDKKKEGKLSKRQ